MMTHSKNCDGESGDGMDPGSPCNCDGPTLTEMVNDFVANFVEFECNDAALAVLNDLIASATVGATARLAAAEARAEKAEGERDRLRDETHGNYSRYLRSLAELASSRAIIGQLNTDAAEAEAAMDGRRSELAEARRQLGEVCERGIMLEQAVSDLRRERDAYRDAKRLGPWMHNGERPWGAPGGTIEEWLRIGPAFVSVNYVRRADGTSEAWGQCPGMSASFRDGDEARSAIDAALASGNWWLEGGPHGAGEAK